MSVFCQGHLLFVTANALGPGLQLCSVVCTSQQTQRVFSLLTSAHYEKNRHRAPECSFANLCERSGTEKPRLGKFSRLSKPEHNVLTHVDRHPKNRTSSFVISRTRLAALPWDPRLAIGRRRSELHRRRSVLDSHLRWRLGKGPQLEKRLPDMQH